MLKIVPHIVEGEFYQDRGRIMWRVRMQFTDEHTAEIHLPAILFLTKPPEKYPEYQTPEDQLAHVLLARDMGQAAD